MFFSLAFSTFLAVLPIVHPSPERRALAYLGREVPNWRVENGCYSCHNNGDAARALFTAVRLGYPVSGRSLDDTSRWLTQPEQWNDKRAEGASADKGLARIQFAAALVEALEAGQVKDLKSLARAAERVAADQLKDGSWKVDAQTLVGTPATYGPYLATTMARRTLVKADPQGYREAIDRADRWLRKATIKTVLDAAAVLLALEGCTDRDAVAQRQTCLELIRKGQSEDGGWGPYVTSSPEAFDTALVILALRSLTADKDIRAMRQRGRAYLIATQLREGNWQETTRPSGSESYAQRLSTTGWATLALLLSRPP